MKRWVVGIGVLAAVFLIAACAGGAESPPQTSSQTSSPTPTPSQTPTPFQTPMPSQTPTPAQVSRPAETTRPLVPPTTVATPTPPAALPPAVAPPTQAPTIEADFPSIAVPAPPSAVDSRGLPLGTTCGPVSCTSPDGVIFVNPDATPGLYDGESDSENLDLCELTYCVPPGFDIIPGQRLPSTGSAGGY